jgi:hypothetical protein
MRRCWAALAAVLAASTLVACGVPGDRTPREIDAGNVPFHLLAPTASATSTTVPSAFTATARVTIYLADADGRLVAARREVEAPTTVDKAVAALLRGPTDEEANRLSTSITSDTKLLDIRGPINGVVTIDLSRQMLDITGRQQILALAQVVYTATSLTSVERVLFKFDGSSREVPNGDGKLTASPLGRLSYKGLLPGAEPGALELVARQWVAEQEALGEVAADTAQLLELKARLDSLGDDGHAEVVGELRNAGDEDRRVLALAQPRDEGPVELDHPGRQPSEVRERRVAGAEVVKGDLHPEGVERLEHGDRHVDVLHHPGLGHLQPQVTRRCAGGGECVGHELHELWVGELGRGQVDTHLEAPAGFVAPCRRLTARLAEHPGAQRDDQAGPLGKWHEVSGSTRSQRRVFPPHQRLGADQPTGRQLEDRLVVQHELATLDCLAQTRLAVEVVEEGGDRAVVELESVLARPLGSVHRRVGVT